MTTRARSFVAFAVTAIVGTLGSCAAPKPVQVDFSEIPRDYRSRDYVEVYQRWTRHGVVRHDIADEALEAWATFKGWDFREAYVEHYAGVYNLSETDKAALRAAQLETFRDSFEFHVAAQSSNYKWNDLEKRNTAWRVTLVDGLGHELAAESVKLEKLPEPYELEFFPAKGPFTRTYAIRFVKPAAATAATQDDGKDSGKDGKDGAFIGAATGSLTLRIASPIGRLELTWQAAG